MVFMLQPSGDTDEGGVGIEAGPPGLEDDDGEGGYPRTDSTYSIDIPNSCTLWEADPRPEHSSQVVIQRYVCVSFRVFFD